MAEVHPLEEHRTGTASPDRDPSLHRVRNGLKNKWVLRLITYGAIALAFQIAAMVQGPFFLPTIPDIATGFIELFTAGHVFVLGPTLQQFAIGFALSMVIAVPIGALMGRFNIVEDLVAPWVNTIFVTEKASLLPIIVLAVGLGFEYRVVVVIMFAIFFPVINTAAGVRYVDNELKEAARAFATSPWRMFTRIYVPAAAPFIVAGTRMGLAMGIKGMVIAELWVSIGTGHLLGSFVLSPRRLDLYYALALAIIAVAVALSESLKAIEKRLRAHVSISDEVIAF